MLAQQMCGVEKDKFEKLPEVRCAHFAAHSCSSTDPSGLRRTFAVHALVPTPRPLCSSFKGLASSYCSSAPHFQFAVLCAGAGPMRALGPQGTQYIPCTRGSAERRQEGCLAGDAVVGAKLSVPIHEQGHYLPASGK